MPRDNDAHLNACRRAYLMAVVERREPTGKAWRTMLTEAVAVAFRASEEWQLFGDLRNATEKEIWARELGIQPSPETIARMASGGNFPRPQGVENAERERKNRRNAP